MKIFGHPWMENEKFYTISSKKDILKTPSGSTLFLGNFSELYGFDLPKYCQKNNLAYVVIVDSIKEAIFANSLGCKFSICSVELAKELMPVAQNYLFDMQILVNIENIVDPNIIDILAKDSVDGIVYDDAFVDK